MVNKMSLLRSFKIQCTKIFTDPLIVVCSLLVLALCCITDVFNDIDSGKEYSVITMLLTRNISDFSESNAIVCENVIRSAMSGWLIMFTPIICVLPFVKSISKEKTSYKRFEMVRCGKNAFTLSRFLAGALSSGVILSVGYGLFMLLSALLFPSAVLVGGNMVRIALRGMSVSGFIFSRLAGAFLIGTVCFLPAYLMSLYSSNKYMIICIPFMLLHFYNVLINRIISGTESDIKKYVQLFLVNGIFKAYENRLVKYEILLAGLLIALSVIFGILTVRKRNDCCE